MKIKLIIIITLLNLLDLNVYAAQKYDCQRDYTDQELEELDLDDIHAYGKNCRVDSILTSEVSIVEAMKGVSWSNILQNAHQSRMKKLGQLADRVRLAFPMLTTAVVDFSSIDKVLNDLKSEFKVRTESSELSYEFDLDAEMRYNDLNTSVGQLTDPEAKAEFAKLKSFIEDYRSQSNEQYQFALNRIQSVISEFESYYKQLQNRVANTRSLYISRFIMDSAFSNVDNLANLIFKNMYLNTNIDTILRQAYLHSSFGIVNQGDIEYQLANFYITQMFIGLSDGVAQKIKENLTYQTLLQTMESVRKVRQEAVNEGVTSVVRSTIASYMQNINSMTCLKRSNEAVRQYNKAIADLNEINKKNKLLTPRLAQISYENIALRFENVANFCRGVQ